MMHTKTIKAIYWATTAVFFLFEGLLPALTSNTQLAIDGIRHLGYPDYFRIMLTVFKILGATALILPVVPKRIKEWAYAGFAFNLTAAVVSHWAVDGLNGQTFFPLYVFAILIASYVAYHAMRKLSISSDVSRKANRFVVPG